MNRVESLLNRPRFYHNIDGVGELGIGFMGLSYSLYMWLQVHSSVHSIWNKFYPFFIFVAIMCAVIHYGTKAIKKRITYPRTGFVSYRKHHMVLPALIVSIVCSVAYGYGLSIVIRGHLDITTTTCLILGLILSACYAWGIARAVRWKWFVVGALAFASITVAFLPESNVAALVDHSWVIQYFGARLVGALLLYFFVYSAIILASGAISFCIYLRNAPKPAPESE
ncbi:MAG: hypothetical protein ACLP7O_04450 [Terracidiphilus sp.]